MAYVIPAYLCTVVPLVGLLLYSVVKYQRVKKTLAMLEKVAEDEKLAG